MGTEVLYPHDCIRLRSPAGPTFPRRKPSKAHPNPRSNSYANPNPRVPRKAASPKPKDGLKRGESLDGATFSKEKRSAGAGILTSHGCGDLIVGGIYAGSVCSVSPSPSALPIPSFPVRKGSCASSTAVDLSATNDLRRLLRLA